MLDFHGKYFTFDNVPMEIEPLQKPHPPIWYGVHSPDSAARAARRSLNVVDLDTPADTRITIDSYRTTWRALHGSAPLPKLGLGRFIVVADTDAEALRLARRAYPAWHASFTHLFRKYHRPQGHPRPADFDALMARGQGIAGSPKTVTAASDIAARRNRLQLCRRAIRLRRPHARRVPAIDCTVRQRRHAGATRKRRRHFVARTLTDHPSN